MFDFADLFSGQLFEHDTQQFAIVKQFGWIAGDKEQGRRYITVNLCLPANSSKSNEWVEVQPKYFVHSKPMDEGDK